MEKSRLVKGKSEITIATTLKKRTGGFQGADIHRKKSLNPMHGKWPFSGADFFSPGSFQRLEVIFRVEFF